MAILNVLIVEDSEDDAELMVWDIRGSGYQVDWVRVETGPEMEAALQQRLWQVILADNNLPGFSAEEALSILEGVELPPPLIVVSGAIRMPDAVDLMRKGARDFVEKGDLSRLVPAIERGLEESEVQRKRIAAEAQVRRLGRILDHSLEEFYIADPQSFRIHDVNLSAARNLGYSPDELRTMTAFDIVVGLTPEKCRLMSGPLLNGEKSLMIVHEFHRRRDGTTYPIEARLQVSRMEQNPLLLVMVQDITERNKAREALRESRERLRLAMESTQTGLWDWDIVANRRYINSYHARILGMDEQCESYDTQAWRQRLHPEEREGILALLQGHLDGGEGVLEMEYRLDDGRGGWVWVVDRGHVVSRDPDGKPLRMVGTINDITVRKNMEALTLRLAEAVEHTGDMILITNTMGNLLYVNPAFERIIGFSQQEVTGRDPGFLFESTDDGKSSMIMASVRSGETWKGRMKARRNDGSRLDVEATVSPVHDGSGAMTGHVAVLRDITRESQLEQQLHQSQKLEAIGTLAGGIAHDFNNILAAIIGYTELSLESDSDDDTVRGNLKEIFQASMRARDLVKQLLTFSRLSEQSRHPVAIKPLISEVMKLVRATFPATITLESNLTESASSLVMADPGQIHQVLMNLFTNAHHAMRAKGGSLRVSLTETQVEEGGGSFMDLVPGEYARLDVEDTGEGMRPEVLERIFDPFYSTRPVGEGSGLGLSVVHGIVSSHGGGVQVRSKPGVGTVFSVFLPLAMVETSEDETEESLRYRDHGHRILLVDDEEEVARVYGDLLESMGCVVKTECDPKAALALFLEQADQFDLILTDQTMPGMTGVELLEKVREVRADMPVVVCTGFSDTITPDSALDQGFSHYLQKPILTTDFSEA
ncbi:MAG: PAS domain S-box protein, partial [Magnetococcales bacterium]|nr:PAS domain S-box protein [Magnetococcales bacterium]